MGEEEKIMEELYELKSKMVKVIAQIINAKTTVKNKQTIERYRMYRLAKPLSAHRTIIYVRLAVRISELLPDKNFED